MGVNKEVTWSRSFSRNLSAMSSNVARRKQEWRQGGLAEMGQVLGGETSWAWLGTERKGQHQGQCRSSGWALLRFGVTVQGSPRRQEVRCLWR